MTTAVYEVAESLPRRFAEIDTLLRCASDNEEQNEQLYDSVCRACCVLLASHLEGFVKDFSKSLISDLNYFKKQFRSMPDALKNTFCRRIVNFEGVADGEIVTRTRQLIDYFDEYSVPIDITAFPYKENSNKNPASKVIESTFERLGVPSILYLLNGSRFENVFGSPSERYLSYTILRETRRHRNSFYNFPYSPPIGELGIKARSKSKGLPKTLWHEFVDDIMVRRHKIAHGDSLENETTHQKLRADLFKLYALMNSMMYAACGVLARKP